MQVNFEPAQFRAYEAIQPGWTVGLGWGRGGGKSAFLRLVWYLLVSKYESERRPNAQSTGVRIVLLMSDLQAAKRVHADLMLAELQDEARWGFLGATVDRTSWRVRFPGGSWIQWVSAEQALSIKGLRCDVICVDECDQVDPVVLDTRAGPWLTEHDSLGIKIVAGTPERGRYGLLYRTWARANGKLLDENGDPFAQYFFSHETSYAFPHYVKRSVVDKERREMVPALFEREYLCNWDAAEGLVYSHFREDFHVRYPHHETQWREHIVGVDWGWEDPTVFLVFGVAGHGKDTQIHQLAEWVMQHKTDSELVEVARVVANMFQDAKWYADPSKPGSIEALRRSVDLGRDGINRGGAGVRIVAADNTIEDGVALVADTLLIRERPEPLGQWSQLFVHPDCRFTIREYGEYRRKRDPRAPDRVLDEIQDKNNHAMDATRYALFSHFGGPDRRIRTGYEAR